MIEKKEIFGRIVAFHGMTVAPYDRLFDELALYPEANNREADFDILMGDFVSSTAVDKGERSRNSRDVGALVAEYDSCTVKFSVDDSGALRTIYFWLKPQGRLRAQAQKWLWYDYVSSAERIGEIFSELVMVPSVFFDPQRFLLHASGVKSPRSEGAVLIGGLGGGGKTSLELELCLNRGYQFISDDIAPVSADGAVYPNLCHPKLYGYNVLGVGGLRKRLFARRGVADKAHWAIRRRLLGPSRVRRRISCADLYGAYATKTLSLQTYYLIVRANVHAVRVEPIEASMAAQASVRIMETEYSAFFNHVLRHEYSSLMLCEKPALKKETVLDRWGRASVATLRGVKNYLLVVPENIEHARFLDEASNIIDKT